MKARLVSTLCFVASSFVFAQEPGKPPGRGPRPQKPPAPSFADFLKYHDRNGDGKVSADEFATGERVARLSTEAREKLFARLDKDKNGFITEKELKMDGRGPGSTFFKKADADGDGRVSREEFLANPPFKRAPQERLVKLFERMDQNKDGYLDRKDQEASRGRNRRPGGGPGGGHPRWMNPKDLDSNKDGGVDWEEFQKAPLFERLPEDRRRALFDRLDVDDDGKLTPGEMREHMRRKKPGPPRDPNGPGKPKR